MNTPKMFLVPSLVQDVEAEYSVTNSRSHNAEVILVVYGDTDSVMARFGPTNLDKVVTMGILVGIQYPLLMVPLTHDRFRQRGSGIRDQVVCGTHQTRV